jgi:hypothetical protein
VPPHAESERVRMRESVVDKPSRMSRSSDKCLAMVPE